MTLKWRRFIALLVAVLLLLATGLLIRRGKDEVVPQKLRRPLSSLDRTLAGWKAVGLDSTLDIGTLDLLKPQDYLLREYRDAGGRRIALFIAFFGEQKEGQMIHSPRHCLPGSGWQIAKREEVKIPTSGHFQRVNHLLLSHQLDRLSVLYWYQGRGRVEADEYMERLRLLWDGISLSRTDGALVRLTTYKESNDAESLGRLISLSQAIIPALDKIMPPSGPARQGP